MESTHRLKISATKALQNLPSEKRSGSTVAYNAYRELVNSPERFVMISSSVPTLVAERL